MEQILYTTLNERDLIKLIQKAIETKEVVAEGSDEKPINQRQAASFLDISLPTIIKWKKEGLIPFERIPGTKKVKYYKSELRRALRAK